MGTALTFGAATTDRVDIGAGSSLADLDPFTIFAWVFPTGTTANRAILGSRGQGAASVRQLRLNGSGGSSGNLELRVTRATTSTSYITNTRPMNVSNTWVCVMATFDSAASPTGRIYTGTLAALLAEATYGTSTAGAGAVSAESSASHTWGNRDVGGFASAFQGRIACGLYLNRVLTLGEGLNLQFFPRLLANTKNFVLLGRNGVGTQPDLSGNGNNGTVTGATASNGPPLGWPFFRSAAEASSVIAAAPAGVTYPQLERYLRGLNRGLAMGSH